jgi:protein gp37
MAANSKIEWTEATWNPIAGCSIVSPGCHHCYAMRTAARLEAMGQAKYAGTTRKVDGKTLWTGKVNLDASALKIPVRTHKPTVWFVNSMSDLFHDDVSNEFIAKVFGVMALAQRHTFQVLTKRTERMHAWFQWIADQNDDLCDSECLDANLVYQFLSDNEAGEQVSRDDFPALWPLPNVWLGVSTEDQQRADERIPWLLQTPATVRFLSCEPLLGAIDLVERFKDGSSREYLTGQFRGLHAEFNDGSHGRLDTQDDRLPKIGWVIVGGESGPGARPMQSAWAQSLRDQCVAAGVPFFFKQWGEWLGSLQDGNPVNPFGQELNATDDPVRVGKIAAGRLLDGRDWNQMPEVGPASRRGAAGDMTAAGACDGPRQLQRSGGDN